MLTKSSFILLQQWRINPTTNLIKNILWIRSASAIPPGIVGKNKRVLPAHMYKPRPRWETGDIDPYPNFDLSKILRPGFENSEELKTADEVVKRAFTLEYATRAEIQEYYSNYLVKAVQRHPLDQSSYEVLIAKLTARIRMHIKYGDIDPDPIHDTNVSRCIDIIELNARVQRELFKLLNLVSAEGGVYGGAATIRARLLPFLNLEQSYLNGLLSDSASDLYPLAWWRYPYSHLHTDAEFRSLANEYDRNLSDLELDLSHANVDNARLEAELEQTRAELIDERVKSTDEKISTNAELSNLRSRLSDAEFRLSLERYKPRSYVVDDYEREIRRLRDDIEFAQRRSRARSLSPVYNYVRRRSLSPPRRYFSSVSTTESLQGLRESAFIQRYNDLHSRDRLNAMSILRTVSADHDMNQRICFNIMQEAFSVSKHRFVEWKLRLRSQLAITLVGGDSLEDVVQDYINRNLDYYELSSIVSEVIDNLHRNPRLSLPLGVTYSLIDTFIREACRLAWHMACLPYPLDLAYASEGEVFDDTKYRRSYDSEYSAPLVDHYIWPALMQGASVVVKGEASTKRGASLSRSRATSPIRSSYISPIRSRSISPIRRSRGRSPVTFSSIYRYY